MKANEYKKVKVGDRIRVTKHEAGTTFMVVEKVPPFGLMIQEKDLYHSQYIDIDQVQVHFPT